MNRALAHFDASSLGRIDATRRSTAALGCDLGVEDVTIELPRTLDLLDNKYLAVAFTACRLLAFGHDRAMRVGAHKTEVILQLHLQQVELNIEVELRQKIGVKRENCVDAGCCGKRLAKNNGVLGINAPYEVEVGFVQSTLIGL